MKKNEDTIEYWWNDFVELVKQNFQYLEKEFKFRLVSYTRPFIAYKSPLMALRLYLDEMSATEFEVDIIAEGIEERLNTLSLDSLITLRGLEGERKNICPSFDHESLEIAVKEAAQFLKKYGTNILNGDIGEFLCLKKENEKRIENGKPHFTKPGHKHLISGIFSVIAGTIYIALGIGLLVEPTMTGVMGLFLMSPIIIPVILSIIGGIYSITRDNYTWATIGAACSIVLCFPLGIPGLILIIKAKVEFD
jgi:hypothetical protein